jgi:PBP1b-binding outer membrane lipoprotein LpoB
MRVRTVRKAAFVLLLMMVVLTGCGGSAPKVVTVVQGAPEVTTTPSYKLPASTTPTA